MIGRHAFLPIILAVALAPLWAQEEMPIQRGTISKVDAQSGMITLTVDGRPLTFLVSERTRIMSASNTPLEGLCDPALKEGAAVMFKPASRKPKAVLAGLKLVGDPRASGAKERVKPADTTSLTPLTELGTGLYKGSQGGLYPDGKNDPPAGHEQAGQLLARQVQPLDEQGRPSPQGKIVLLSVGMSNTTMEFSAFRGLADADPQKSPKVIIVDGAQGGMTAARIRNPDDNASGAQYWTKVDERLKAAGVTREQVQVAWIKQANARPAEGFPAYAKTLHEQLAAIVQLLRSRFPNIKLAYLSSRIYGGYASTALNPEPYAYESGFSVKWLIAQQIQGDPALNLDPQKGPVRAPWLAWGPYLWANGTAKLPDGLSYEPADLGPDGMHPSLSGQRKVAERLLHFFKTDPTAKSWFVHP